MTAIQYIAARVGLELNQGFSNRPQQLLECLVPAKLRSKASISHDDKYYVIDIDGIKIRLEFISFDGEVVTDFDIGRNDVNLSIINRPIINNMQPASEIHRLLTVFRRAKDRIVSVRLSNLKIQEIEQKCIDLREYVEELYEYALEKCR